jgi:hypothetical protein
VTAAETGGIARTYARARECRLRDDAPNVAWLVSSALRVSTLEANGANEDSNVAVGTNNGEWWRAGKI